jgi:hypothetical protein
MNLSGMGSSIAAVLMDATERKVQCPWRLTERCHCLLTSECDFRLTIKKSKREVRSKKNLISSERIFQVKNTGRLNVS